MLIAAFLVTLLWLLLALQGLRSSLLPNEQFIAGVTLAKQEARQRQQAASGKPQAKRRKSSKPSSKLIYAPAYRLYNVAGLEQRAMTLLHVLHSYMLQLHRYQWSFDGTVYLLNEAVGQALLVLVVGCWLAYAAEEWAIAAISLVIAIVLVLNVFQSAKAALAQRRKAMLMELPKLLTRLTLLVGAGDSIQTGFIKCAQHKQASDHPLYVEWNEAVHELKNGVSFSVVVEKLNRNCAVQQMSLLTTILLLNYRKGGEHFISSVQELSLSLWETRKTMARTKGEEASSKMIFPLVGILLLLMMLIVAPAIFMMQNM